MREANFTDAFRFLAALSVVWYHNPYFWSLGSSQDSVAYFKLFLLGWSMPFFYITTARFALSCTKMDKLADRVGKIVMLMMFYTFLYELINLKETVKTGYLPFRIDWNAGLADSAQSVLSVFRSVNNSPGYYLSDVIAISIIAFIVSLVRSYKIILRILLVLSIVAIMTVPVSEYSLIARHYFLNPLALGSMVIGFFYQLVLWKKRPGSKVVSTPQNMLVIFIPLILWGLMNLFYMRDVYWGSGAILASVPLLFLLVFPYIGDNFTTCNSFISRLSEWGQKYSLGIFLWHQFVFSLTLPLFIHAAKLFGINEFNSILYFIIGIGTTIISIAITKFLRKYTPALVTI